jgi:hypothetical protein
VTPPAWIRPVLWAVVGVCLVAGLVAIPIVGDGGDTDLQADGRRIGSVGGADDGESTTTSTESPYCQANGGCGAGDAVGDGGDAPASAGAADQPAPAATSGKAGSTNAPAGAPSEAPTTTAATTAATPATTAAPSEDLGPPGDPGPATVPRPGTYRYKATDSEGERQTSTKIEDRPPSGAPERRQLYTIRGEGFDTDNEIAWRGDGVFVLSTVITFGQNKGTCDWNPDTVQLKLPIAKGASWESSSTCQMTGFGATPIPLNRKITGKFLEVRRIRVAGQVVDVWAIEGTEHLDGAGQVVDRSGITLFSPKHGVQVSASGKVTTTQGTTEYRTEILNLDPE